MHRRYNAEDVTQLGASLNFRHVGAGGLHLVRPDPYQRRIAGRRHSSYPRRRQWHVVRRRPKWHRWGRRRSRGDRSIPSDRRERRLCVGESRSLDRRSKSGVQQVIPRGLASGLPVRAIARRLGPKLHRQSVARFRVMVVREAIAQRGLTGRHGIEHCARNAVDWHAADSCDDEWRRSRRCDGRRSR